MRALKTIDQVLVAAILLSAPSICWSAEEVADGQATNKLSRVSWDTSRVIGSPEPPLPFRTEQLFKDIAFKHPLYATVLPGTNRLLVVEQAGQILSIPNVPDATESEVFLKLEDH